MLERNNQGESPSGDKFRQRKRTKSFADEAHENQDLSLRMRSNTESGSGNFFSNRRSTNTRKM